MGESFDSFYRREYDKAVAYARRFSRNEAEDLAQDSFCELLSAMMSRKKIRALGPLFQVILKRNCMNWERDNRRRAEIEELHPAL